jgi:tripartite-type tricarboxylate transporter receptor subunit TctC
MVLRLRRKCIVAAVLCLQYLHGNAVAEIYPNRPIRMLAPEIGGASDIAARLVAQSVSAGLGQQVVVDNRGSIAPEIAAKAPPDGYTLIAYGSPLWLNPFLRDNVPWDPMKDFLPITSIAIAPNVLIVHPSVPAHSVKELVALAKAKPGALNYASGSSGALTHLTGELFNAMAGVKIVRVPYRGNGPALNALYAGEVQLMFANAGSVIPQLKSGRMKALAVTSAQPSPLVPGLPTVAAEGVPRFESLSIIGVFAPARTPSAVISRLNTEIVKALNASDLKAKYAGLGVEAVGSSPDEFRAAVRRDMAKWGTLIKDAGIRE